MARKATKKPKKAKAPGKPVAPSPVATEAPKPTGRPSKYTKELATRICVLIAEGNSLRKICAADDMPSKATVLLWAMENREGFLDQYTRARDLQLESEADEIVDIADDGTHDYDKKITKDGDEVLSFNKENVERSKLKVHARQWRLSKLNAKKYGDKIEQTHKADAGFLDLWKHISAKGDD